MAGSSTGKDTQAGESLDVLVVGAGFGGLYQLYQLREKGYKVKGVEAAGGLGGVWYWNCYPGARTDTDIPSYEYSFGDLYKDWTWSERFPSFSEVQRYLKYVDEKLDLSKDIKYDTAVVAAEFDKRSCRWNVRLSTGENVDCRHFVLCTGFATKRYIPAFRGLQRFKGIIHHTAAYPQEGIDLKGKKVAIIGTGASGVQLIQEIGPEVGQLTVFQRTPNLCVPMQQQALDPQVEADAKGSGFYAWAHKYRRTTFGGMHFDFYEKNGSEDNAEQKKALYEKAWSEGGFHFWLGTYKDVLINKAVNDTLYEFWAEKTRARIHDPEKRDILAPLLADQPHSFGTKRPSLEQRFYEVCNQSNVEIVSLKHNPIDSFTEDGLRMHNGDDYLFDVILLATGFDSHTGGLCAMDIRGLDGTSLADKWSKGTRTYLGMATANFPNMFFVYGPQAPTAFATGPTIVEAQGDWIVDVIDHCTRNGKKTIEATAEAEAEWTKHVAEVCNATLLPGTDSWYMGTNIPGKTRESLNYLGGLPTYVKKCDDVAKKGYTGFSFHNCYNSSIQA